MSEVEKRIERMGYRLPEPPKSLAVYVPALKVQDFLYVSGQVPVMNGEIKYPGKVGKDLTVEQASNAARICALNCLAAIKAVIGNLDNVRVVKVTGFVNSADNFTAQHLVVDGASKFLQDVLGTAGVHVRSAIGVAALPFNVSVELEMIALVAG